MFNESASSTRKNKLKENNLRAFLLKTLFEGKDRSINLKILEARVFNQMQVFSISRFVLAGSIWGLTKAINC